MPSTPPLSGKTLEPSEFVRVHVWVNGTFGGAGVAGRMRLASLTWYATSRFQLFLTKLSASQRALGFDGSGRAARLAYMWYVSISKNTYRGSVLAAKKSSLLVSLSSGWSGSLKYCHHVPSGWKKSLMPSFLSSISPSSLNVSAAPSQVSRRFVKDWLLTASTAVPIIL